MVVEAVVLVDPASTIVLRQGATERITWDTRLELCTLDCAVVGRASSSNGRRAGPAHAAEIARLCNAAHGGEKLFVPYTVQSLAERLERAPDLYTWEDVLIGDGAVVGVWDQHLRVVYGDGREQRRAIVLDAGFVPGEGEAAFVEFLRTWCACLAARGTTHLAVFTSARSAGRDAIASLAETVEPFVYACRLREPQPPGPIYFDAVHA